MNSQRLTIDGKTKPYVMAHRGNLVTCPENTLAAFNQAITDGADILETDLHLTSDQEFVCIHDSTVDRTTDGIGTVSEMTLAQIKSLSAAYGRPEFEFERIPTLSEVIGILPPDLILAIELKTDSFFDTEVCKRLIAELDHNQIRERTIVFSFSLSRLQVVRAIAPDIISGWITMTKPWPFVDAQLLGPLWPLILANPFYVWMAHLRGRAVCPLDPTPDSRLWLYKWLGCDAILTNDPYKTCKALMKYKL